MSKPPRKLCERCKALGRRGICVPGYRFCHICIGVVKRKMRKDGYIEFSPEERRNAYRDS